MKRLLPLITALVLTLYVTVPGELNPRFDLTGAAVAELQDDVVYTSPKQDDHCLLPSAVTVAQLISTASALPPARTARPLYRPSVPNIRDPPPSAAV